MSDDPTEFFLRLQESVDHARQNTERAAFQLRERLTAQCQRLLGQTENLLDSAQTQLSQPRMEQTPSPSSQPWKRHTLMGASLFLTGMMFGWLMP
ncbi:hypothetical protein AD931_02985 [Gluconobacter oxydans]|uniref:DUF883 domain-containing protein n=1 Tax=Gluconobacter oxydans TaxID=442 RepID=A0AB34XN92_GLUOY|nr:hypothetical protein [Gluconobacter oxydans]KXV09840.1 hypothetical protein AD931_02985 [Gluconobacter oxydans]